MIGQGQVWYKMISYLALDFLLFTVFIKNRHETNNGNLHVIEIDFRSINLFRCREIWLEISSDISKVSSFSLQIGLVF